MVTDALLLELGRLIRAWVIPLSAGNWWDWGAAAPTASGGEKARLFPIP
jgi:hypothetical protein